MNRTNYIYAIQFKGDSSIDMIRGFVMRKLLISNLPDGQVLNLAQFNGPLEDGEVRPLDQSEVHLIDTNTTAQVGDYIVQDTDNLGVFGIIKEADFERDYIINNG